MNTDNKKPDDFEPDFEIHEIGDLETIYIYLDKENLEIREAVNEFLLQLKQKYSSTDNKLF